MLAEAEVLVGHWGCPTLTPEVLDLAPRLRVFAYAAGTVKWQVTDAVWERGIIVTSAAAANAVPVAEYTVAMILLANKGVLLFRELLRDPTVSVPLEPSAHRELRASRRPRRRVAGRSARDRAARSRTTSTVAVYDPYLSAEEAARLGVEKVDDLDDLCASVDVLSLHAPDVEATRSMIGADAARGVARRRDVPEHRPSRARRLGGVGSRARIRSDRRRSSTWRSPIRLRQGIRCSRLPNVFVTPHVAGAMGNELHRLAELAVVEVERYAAGEPPLHPVTRADLDRIA